MAMMSASRLRRIKRDTSRGYAKHEDDGTSVVARFWSRPLTGEAELWIEPRLLSK
jgi:hypothetical protein